MPSSKVRADVFPSILDITSPDGETTHYEKVRTVVTLDHVYIFRDGSPFETVFEDRLTTYQPPVAATRVKRASELLSRYATLTTEDGYEVQFKRAGNCGCGSQLKNASLSQLLPDSPLPQAASSKDSA